ncbi:putative peptidoglycan binding domain protein [Serratia marcescens]|nr:putative peptidoglycan binding domain protein [Serratia marcescens]
MKAIRKGDRGNHVKSLQELLNKQGAILNSDGIFGLKTELAVKKVQRKKVCMLTASLVEKHS